VLLYCCATVQWAQWKTVSWVAALMVIATMLVPVLNAWLPTPLATAEGMRVWQTITVVESIVMMGYSGLAMWQVGHWIDEARDANYSNPDDHPNETKEAAAIASGFSSYTACYRAKQKLKLQI